jgi:hypothetical protein
MTFVIVPNVLRDEIYRRIDAALAETPDAAPDREIFYEALLSHFHQHGAIPEFSLVKNTADSGSGGNRG